ncbi:MAG: hypothetical protein JWN57_1393 [Frankiales bacterium]|nr:hypothetical protein [Frankiales bacterium]
MKRWLPRALRAAFVLAVVAGLALFLRGNGEAFTAALARTSPAAVLASLAAVLVGLLCSAMVWRALLTDLGSRLPLRTALHVFFLGQLGKYVPGSVFAVAAQMELGRDQGVPRSRVGTASLLFMGVLVAAGLLVAVATLPVASPGALDSAGWLLVALPVGLICLAPPVLTRLVAVALKTLRRAPLDHPLSARGVGAALGWALAMWVAYGVHALLLVQAQPTGGDANALLLSLGGYALAWTVGFVVVLAPAGGGAREAAFVVAFAPLLARPDALAVAVLSRVLMTVGDLVWGGLGALLRPPVVRSESVQQLGKAADV